MNIILYKTASENNLVNKESTLIELLNLEGTLKASTSIINPSIIVEMKMGIEIVTDDNITVVYDDNVKIGLLGNSLLLDCNYAYIPDFKRYYFIDDIVSVNNKLWNISMSVDTLMSFKEEFLQLEGFITRNEYLYDPKINDNLISFKANKFIEYLQYENISECVELDTAIPKETYSGVDNRNTVISYVVRNGHKVAESGLDELFIQPSQAPLHVDGLPDVNNNTLGTNLSTMYLAIESIETNYLAESIFKNDTLKSYLKHITIYPYKIKNEYYPVFTNASAFCVPYGAQDNWLYMPYNAIHNIRKPKYSVDRLKICDIMIEASESFLDYSPYTRYEIFIPYYGYVELSGEAIKGHNIQVYFDVYFEDGTTTAFIFDNTIKKILWNQKINFGVRLGLSSSNMLEINNQKNAIELNSVLNGLSSIISIGSGIASSNPIVAMGGLMRLAQTVGSKETSYNQLYDIGKVDMSNPNDGLFNLQTVHIKKTKALTYNYDHKFFKLNGRPLNQVKKLSTLHGFTIINDIHLEISATSGEKKNLIALFNEGIIL